MILLRELISLYQNRQQWSSHGLWIKSGTKDRRSNPVPIKFLHLPLYSSFCIHNQTCVYPTLMHKLITVYLDEERQGEEIDQDLFN